MFDGSTHASSMKSGRTVVVILMQVFLGEYGYGEQTTVSCVKRHQCKIYSRQGEPEVDFENSGCVFHSIISLWSVDSGRLKSLAITWACRSRATGNRNLRRVCPADQIPCVAHPECPPERPSLTRSLCRVHSHILGDSERIQQKKRLENKMMHDCYE
jgi:hypothetical protein